jgi:hypothetical protein
MWKSTRLAIIYEVVDGVMWKIAGDFACTKFLHEDGHVY